MGLDLHKLEHLIAVAEEGSFTRAATRLHLSQQALSTSIRALEREIGVELLDRGRNTVTVLPAGSALIADARVLHGMAQSALQRTRRIGRGEPELLRIGHTPAVTSEEVAALLRELSSGADLDLEVNQRYPRELTEQLLAGDLELGLSRAMSPAHGLTRSTLTHHRLRIAVSAEHHLAGREGVELAELADETFKVWGRRGHSGYTDLLVQHCRDAGFEPRTLRSPVQGTPPLTAVLGTDHLAFVTAAPGPAVDGHLWVLDLLPPVLVPLHALWSPHTSSVARDTFLSQE